MCLFYLFQSNFGGVIRKFNDDGELLQSLDDGDDASTFFSEIKKSCILCYIIKY